ncbi:histone 3 [Senna tora]|uniref:Histone 3 n=1 Tax=Senna tora TaxID=362788 RepID=A0A834SJ62_9FABA|nr:histone 3 [Senna tora]
MLTKQIELHNGDSLSVNGTEISILEEPNQVSLGSFLKSGHGGALESEICLEILSDLTNQSLERKLPDQKLGALLVLPDLTKSHRTWPEAVRLLHAAGGRSGLPSSLGRQLLPRSLTTGGLASGLLGTSHWSEMEKLGFEDLREECFEFGMWLICSMEEAGNGEGFI